MYKLIPQILINGTVELV